MPPVNLSARYCALPGPSPGWPGSEPLGPRGAGARASLGLLAACVLGLGLLGGCTRAPDDPLAAARAEIAAGKSEAAIVILKDALQRKREDAGLRGELARALLLRGDAAGALAELDKIAAQGQLPEALTVLRARAQLASGQWQAVADGVDGSAFADATARADLATLRAQALLQLARPEAAQAALDSALQAQPQHAPARLLQARLQAVRGEIDAALAKVQQVIEQPMENDADQADAWAMRGDLLYAARRDAGDAEAAWTTALQHDPRHVGAHAGLLELAFAALPGGDAAKRVASPDLPASLETEPKPDETPAQTEAHASPRAESPLTPSTSQAALATVEQRLAAARSALGGHPLVLLNEGRWALLRGQRSATEQALQQLLKLSPEDPRVLLLAGQDQLQRGDPQAALPWLEKAAARSLSHGPRLLLAQVQLQLGEDEAALQTLQELPGSAQVWALQAQAHLRRGELPQAQALFEQAARAEPANPRHALGGVLALAAREPRRALAQAQALAQKDDSGLADQLLIALRQRAGDHAGALKAVAVLQAKQPGQPLAALMRGQLLMQQAQLEPARQSFEEVLQLSPGLLPAVFALAELDVRQAQPQTAVDRLSDWLAQPDQNPAARVRASLALAQAQAAAGLGVSRQLALLQAALAEAADLPAPQTLPLHAAIINLQLQGGQTEAALHSLQAVLGAHPQAGGQLPWLRLQAQVHERNGQPRQAIQAWRQALAQQPDNPDLLAALGAAYGAAGEASAGERRLQDALRLDPGHLPSLHALVIARMAAGDEPQALHWARQAQTRQPKRPDGWQWEGSIHAERKQWTQALSAWHKAQARGERSDTAMRIYSALRASGQSQQAEALLHDWQQRHPQELALPTHVADTLAAEGGYAQAEALYRQLLATRPQDAHLLNNLAWVRLRQGQPDALQWAEQALASDPNAPVVMDTLAQALAADGQLGRALELQEKVVELAPRRPSLRLSLAQLALEAGDSRRARQELTILKSEYPRFAARPEVAALEEKLR